MSDQLLDIYWARRYIRNMKTIAVTIDEPTLTRVDQLLARDVATGRSRSAFVREALRGHLRCVEVRAAEQEERLIWRRHRQKLERQAAALIREQATP